MKTSMKNYFVRLFIALLFLTTANAFAQVNVAGKPKRLGNLEVAQFDFPKAMDWWEAQNACANLTGGGWRLPTEIELNSLYINRLKIGGFKSKPAADWEQGDYVKDFWSTYWTSFTEGRQFARLQYFSTGKKTLGNAYDKINVRAVRSLTNVLKVMSLNPQLTVIGKPKKIEKMEIAQFDFPMRLQFWEAKRIYELIGGGWRLPTKDELNVIYENKDVLGGLIGDYWSSTPVDGDQSRIWGQDFNTGKQGEWGITRGTAVVRMVRVL
jgi:hypothetical protein